jgi:hypothetical protein
VGDHRVEDPMGDDGLAGRDAIPDTGGVHDQDNIVRHSEHLAVRHVVDDEQVGLLAQQLRVARLGECGFVGKGLGGEPDDRLSLASG